jgi:hypothetical protein
MEHLKNGVVCHTILAILPMWSNLTKSQKRVAKELLHQCQILHPIGDTKFGSDTNVVVPALWFANQDMTCSIPDMEEAITRRYSDTSSISCMCWEYEFSMNTLPESFFELFIVESYHCNMERKVQLNSLEVWVSETSSLGLFTFNHFDSNYHIIKIEVASNTPDTALKLIRYSILVIESLL